MGTNYYVVHCDEGLDENNLLKKTHIGKSSAGWCFALHVVPTRKLMDWPSWKKFLQGNTRVSIVDEYNAVYLFEDFAKIVEERQGRHNFKAPIPENLLSQYTSWKQFFELNYAKPGPNGLVRADPNKNRSCLGNGRGTYDYIVGDFS